METMNHRIELTDLPAELLFLIFRQAHSVQPQSRIYSILRLVCRALDRVATQLVFQEFTATISSSTSSESLETLQTIFENHAHCIRSLTIHNTISRKREVEKQTISRIAQHITERGCFLCTKIRSLACLGSHGMFSSRSWLSLPMPPNLTSLTFTPNKGSTDLSYCLLALKDSLRSLEIINWRPQHDNPPTFHLPTSLPHLTDLTLTGCYPPPPHIQKLFSRFITPSSPQNAAPAVALHSLTVRPESGYEPDFRFPSILADIVSILSTRQFGARLRTVCIGSPRFYHMEATIPIMLLRLCPNLVEFTYHCERVNQNVLSSLPSTLEVLELSPCLFANTFDASPHGDILSPTFLALWLRDGPQQKRSAPGLRRVTVNVSGRDLCDMLEVLEGSQPDGTHTSVSADCFTCIDIHLEGETFQVTPS